MNILLIQPCFNRQEKSYPLGLGYISAVLKERGHDVTGADCSFSSKEDIISMVEKKGVRLIGISLMSFSFEGAAVLCREIKKVTDVPVAAGGPHVTVSGKELLSGFGDCFDYLITGEGEASFSRLAECLESGAPLTDVPRLIYKSGEDIIINPPGDDCRDRDLDALPLCDRELFPVRRYKGMFTRDRDYTQMITSRGCPRSCAHCPEPELWKGWRGRSADNVIDEIEFVSRGFGIREFHFEDANFFGGGTGRVKELCEKMIRRVPGIKWRCPNGIPVMAFDDLSVLDLMGRAGCYSICLGVETFDEEGAAVLGRRADYGSVERIIRAARAAGIEAVGYFMIGLPGQTEKQIKRDVALSRKLDFDFVHYSIFHLIPGAGLCKRPSPRPAVGFRRLKKLRSAACLVNCLRPRAAAFGFRNLTLCKDPVRVASRALGFVFNSQYGW